MKTFDDEFLRWEAATHDVLDFKKIYVDMAGGDVRAGLMLSEIVYWYLPSKEGRSRLRVRRDGRDWIAARRYEWWERCRLSPRQADRAGRILEKHGLIVRALYKFSAEPTVHYSINLEEFINAWEKALNFPTENPFLPNSENEFPETGNGFTPNGEKAAISPNGERFLPNGENDFTETRNGFSPNGKNDLPETGNSLTETTDREYLAETSDKEYFSENARQETDDTAEAAAAEEEEETETKTSSSSSSQPALGIAGVPASRKYVPPPPGTRERIQAAVERSRAKLQVEKESRWLEPPDSHQPRTDVGVTRIATE